MKETQAKMILEHMIRYGSITQLEAMNDYGCARLAARIADLKRRGVKIESEMVTRINRYGLRVHVKQYKVVQEA